MTSIRRRVLGGALAAIVLALIAAGIGIYLLFRSSLLTEFDAGLAQQARALAAMVEIDGKHGQRRYHVEIPPTWNGGLYRLRGDDGAVIACAPGTLPDATGDPAEDHVVMIARGADSPLRLGTWRCPVLDEHADEVGSDGGQSPPATVQVTVMRSTATIDDMLRRLTWVLSAVIAGVSVIAISSIAWIMTRALAPLERLAERIAGLGDRSLHERLDAPDCRELIPVVERLNHLFDRLDQAFAKEKSFNAAIAHELRTPLAGLLTTLEVCAVNERSGAEYRETLAICQRITGQMQTMAERLLLLAKLDADQLPTVPRPLALDDFLGDCWTPHAHAAAERGLTVEWIRTDGLTVIADRDLLRMVFSNLFDNAISHADHRGTLRVATRTSATELLVEIRNTGCRLSADAFTHIFARFWRGDAARDATGRHCGLGLSLCHELLRALGGSITARTEDGWFVATVHLPVRPTAHTG